MTIVNVNGKEYDFDKLSENAKAQLKMIQVADQMIARLNAQLSISQTARMVYEKALEEELSKTMMPKF